MKPRGVVALALAVIAAVAPAASRVAAPASAAATAAPCGITPASGAHHVSSSDGLRHALDAARPGEQIWVVAGHYAGRFALGRSGTATAPVAVCGAPGAVLDGGSTSHGYVLHLTGSWIRVGGFVITRGLKGVVLDHAHHVLLDRLFVHDIGEEGVHFRTNSTDDVLTRSRISHTGEQVAAYGEGVYIGSAHSNWCSYTSCLPDRSDRNTVSRTSVGYTTAESIDVKEGTSSGVLASNVFDGAGMTAADSWVDVKGNGWQVTGNSGSRTRHDGFQAHDVATGWGRGNLFAGNSAVVPAGGLGFRVGSAPGSVVRCDNHVAGGRFSDVRCR